MEKTAIRAKMRARRKALSLDEAREKSRAAQECVLASREWQEAASVALYMAVRNETGTGLLADNAWETGKRVYFPCTAKGADGHMTFAACERGGKLVQGWLGIPEPVLEPEGFLQEDAGWAPDIVIVPGLAFDRSGLRVGMGGGYYDRFLAKESMRNVLRIGLAYAFQVLDRVPAEAWDASMHVIATEEGLLWF